MRVSLWDAFSGVALFCISGHPGFVGHTNLKTWTCAGSLLKRTVCSLAREGCGPRNRLRAALARVLEKVGKCQFDWGLFGLQMAEVGPSAPK